MDSRLTPDSPTPSPAAPASRRGPTVGRVRIAGRIALIAAVVGMHACVVRNIGQRMADLDVAAALPARIELVYGREMEPTAPPPVVAPVAKPAAAVRPPRRARQATPVVAAASAPSPEAEPAVAGAPATAASDAMPAASAPAATIAEGSSAVIGPTLSPPPPSVDTARGLAAAAAASAASTDTFAWPPSTRISYELSGNYRGEVHGSAIVDWVRVGARYQVHLDVLVGPSFAPLLSRRMTSEGQLTDAGLYPERYDEDSKAMFRDHRRAHVTLEADAVVLNNGQRVERLPGVQDTASQFVQLSYLFTRHPELLKPGGTIEIPLALPKRMSRWIYDVRESEVLYTPFGAIEAVPLQPRRESRKGDELAAQAWFAPSLHYLPVRIRIQQDADTYIDLMIERRPQMAVP